MKKKVLLLSGYDAASHRYWRQLLEEQLVDYDWTQLAMPDRHFSWRVRGNSMSFAYNHTEVLQRPYDLIIATSMVDLSSLRGFCPTLSTTPTIVYFHENQFAFPVPNAQQNLVAIQLTSIYTALCADKVLFNSNYNKSTFLNGAKELLARLPDQVPTGLIAQMSEKSAVLAVPIRPDVTDYRLGELSQNVVPEIVWNHRWEYDKQPDVFFNALAKLKAGGTNFKLHLLGQSFRNSPACFQLAKEQFKDEIISYGYCDRNDYLSILAKADLVVSSSLHDFQGLSMQEAAILGCTPIAPNRVAYPEYLDEQYLYNPVNDEETEVNNLFELIHATLSNKAIMPSDLHAYHTEQLIPEYRRYIDDLLI